MILEANPDRTLVRTRGGSRRYVAMLVAAPASLNERPRPPVNLAVVVDRSGSMHGDKIARARDAALNTIRSMRERDYLTLVAYDDAVEVLLPSSAIDANSRRDAERAVRELFPRGTTNLCEGWLRGCEQVGRHLDDGRIGRALLMSDGLANRGITDPLEIARHAAALRERGVSTSAFGIGEDFDEDLLGQMTEAGGGNFYFVECAEQIPAFVAAEVGESLDVVARDVSMVLTVPEGACVRSLNGYPLKEDGTRWSLKLGDLVSRQELEVAIEIRFPSGTAGDAETLSMAVRDADGVLDDAVVKVGYRYADDPDNDRQRRDLAVDRKVAALFAASARLKALRLNRDGCYDEARRTMLACADRIAGYAGADPELNGILDDVRRAARQYRRAVSSHERKRSHAASLYSSRSRDYRGSSRRSAR